MDNLIRDLLVCYLIYLSVTISLGFIVLMLVLWGDR